MFHLLTLPRVKISSLRVMLHFHFLFLAELFAYLKVRFVRDGPLENLWGWGGGAVGRITKKKYSRKGKLNEKKFMHAN